MSLPISKNGKLTPLPQKRLVIADFEEGQITQKEDDKIPFTSASLIENLILWKGNLDVREGSTTLMEDDKMIAVAKGETTGDNKLLTFTIDGTTKKINVIDRDDGTKTSYTASNLDSDSSWTNGKGSVFFSYGTGIDTFNPNDGTVATLGGGKGKLLTYAEDRLWSAGDDGLFYSTIGVAEHSGSVFNGDMGTYDATTGRYPWGMSHGGQIQTGNLLSFTALVSVGRTVVVFGKNELQVHKLPTAQYTTYLDKEQSTLQAQLSFGVKSKYAVKVIGEYVYFVNDDGFFRLDTHRGRVTPLSKNIGQHRNFDWADASIGYNKKWEAVLLSGKQYGANDITIVYFIKKDAFTVFTNLQPLQWVELEDDIYFLNSRKNKLVKAFGDGMKTDDGVPIKYNLVMAAMDAGLPEYYKKTREIFIDVASEGDETIKIPIYHDRLFGGDKAATNTFTITFDKPSGSYKGTYGSSFGDAPLGMSMTGNSSSLVENKERFKDRTKFAHVEITINGTSQSKVSIRRIVLTYQNTPKKIKEMYLTK